LLTAISHKKLKVNLETSDLNFVCWRQKAYSGKGALLNARVSFLGTVATSLRGVGARFNGETSISLPET